MELGGLYGSAFVDASFETWVSVVIGGDQWGKLTSRAKKGMLSDFESVKRSFDPRNEPEYSVELKGVEDDESKGISEELIVIKS